MDKDITSRFFSECDEWHFRFLFDQWWWCKATCPHGTVKRSGGTVLETVLEDLLSDAVFLHSTSFR